MRTFNRLFRLFNIIVASLYVAILFSQPGTLISDFGNRGIVVIDVGGEIDIFRDVITFKNGDILAVGESRTSNVADFVLAKFDRSGSLITSFRNLGIYRGNFGTSTYNVAIAVCLDKNENILTAMNSYSQETFSNRAVISRFLPSGELDSSFATNGQFMINDVYNSASLSVNTVKAHSGGSIFAAMEKGSEFGLVKLTEEGKIDSSFAVDGVLIIDKGNGIQRIRAIAFEPEHVVATGETYKGNDHWTFFLMRCDPSGRFDSTFFEDGYYEDSSFVNSTATRTIAIQADGKILIAGSYYNGQINEALVLRYLSNGQLDIAFGDQGKVQVPSYGSQIQSIFSLPDQTIVMGGENVVMKLMPDGQVDSTFGFNGIAISSNTGILVYKMTLDGMNQIVVAGSNGQDAGLVKFALDESTAVVNNFNSNRVSIHPNPMQEHFSIEFNLEAPQKIRASLYNIEGKLIEHLIIEQVRNSGRYNEQLRVDPSLLNGEYLLYFTIDKQRRLYKIVKM